MKTSNRIARALASLAVCVITLPSVANATDYYVHATAGNNNNSGTQPNQAFADLGYAMKKLRAGDTLHVRSGTYRSMGFSSGASGTQAQPIVVKPYLSEKPVISATAQSRMSNNRWWVFQDLTFQNSEAIKFGNTSSGNCTSYAENIVFQGNRFQHSNYAPLKLQCARNFVVANNLFDNIRTRQLGVAVQAFQISFDGENILVAGNTFRDIGGDAIQLGGVVKNIDIRSNLFEVVRPYVYRDVNGNAVSPSQQPFDNVGENAIDIKSGPGPTSITGNMIRGFRSSSANNQDATGSMGSGIILHKNTTGVVLRKNQFFDNRIHLTIQGIKNIVVSNNIFNEASDEESDPRGLYVRDVSGLQVYNNTFYSLKGSDETLLDFHNVSGSILQNNLFHNGQVQTTAGSYVMDVHGDHNAWSNIRGGVPSALGGPRDLTMNDPGINWADWKPKAGSPLIDEGMQVGISDDFYGAPISGVAPEIGAVEYGSAPSPQEPAPVPPEPTPVPPAPTPAPPEPAPQPPTEEPAPTLEPVSFIVNGSGANTVVVVDVSILNAVAEYYKTKGASRVALFANGNLVSKDSRAPYSFNWNASSYAGSSVTLRAVVNWGNRQKFVATTVVYP